MTSAADGLVDLIRDSLLEIGYADDLLVRDYSFADFTAEAYDLVRVELAAFAQQPPSYRNACFGVTILPQLDAAAIARLRALGAPQILSVDASGRMVHRWKMVAEGDPVLQERITPPELRARILEQRELWNPDPMLRAKSIGVYNKPAQLDLLYDTGLLPVLEREVHAKLDQLFGETIHAATAAYKAEHGHEPSREDMRGLFRLIFRLIAAKLLADRGHEGDWLNPDPAATVRAVNEFYYRRTTPEPVLDNPRLQQIVWDHIRSGFRLQNLSVEALAYVYENTFVSVETRKRYDTHATPHEVAEYVLARLPIEDLPQDSRTVFEPFAGHAPFLTAALGRLRALLPRETTVEERHDYLVRMLRGMEVDAFAREVAYASLILADYPNANGWQLDEDDVFTSPDFGEALARARVVVCNPPYGNFTAEERALHPSIVAPNKAVEALRRVLEEPPEMLGFVLPRPVADGQAYRALRRQIARRYDHVEIVALPDRTFRHSGIDIAVLIAHSRRSERPVWESVLVRRGDYDRFFRTGEPSWREHYSARAEEADGDEPVLWRAPLLGELVGATTHLRRLKDIVEIHRGVQYHEEAAKRVRPIRAGEPEPGPPFYPGLGTVRGRLWPHAVVQTEYVEVSPELMRWKAHLLPWSEPKVVANAVRASRGAWTIIAAAEREGLVCTTNFYGIWPKDETPLEVIAAVINGPLANAWITLQRGSPRHNSIRELEQVPLPLLSRDQQARVVELVRAYSAGVVMADAESVVWNEDLARMLSEIDLLVLSGYDLPEALESALLDTFDDQERPGAPWFRGYPKQERERETGSRLRELAEIWRDDTYDLSSYTAIVGDPAYQHVIKRFGAEAVPFLLGELESGHFNWVWALREITRQDPVPEGDQIYIDRVAQAWVKWGRENGLQ